MSKMLQMLRYYKENYSNYIKEESKRQSLSPKEYGIRLQKKKRKMVNRGELAMKKMCKGCYAAETGGHPLSGEPYGCTLGYTIENGKPLEECPKPKSWKALNKAEKKERLNR